MKQPTSDLQSPAHPTGKPFARFFAPIPKFEQLEQFLDSPGTIPTRDLVQCRMDFHVLQRGQFIIEARILKYDSKPFANFARRSLWVQPVELDCATGGFEQSGEHFDRRGLA